MQRFHDDVQAAKPGAPHHHPRLLFGPEDVPRLRAFAETDDGRAILTAMNRAFEREMDGITIGSHAAGHALRFVLSGNQRHADEARRIVEKTIEGVSYGQSDPLWPSAHEKMIFRVPAAVGVAIAYDLFWPAWEADFRRKVAAELDRLARQFLRGGGQGFNDRPYSNWMGTTQAGAGVLILAAMGDEGATHNLHRQLGQAERGFFDYMRAAYGDRGWCVEGFNYIRYTMTTSGLPFLNALTRHRGRDVVTGTPAEWLAPLYVKHLVPGDETPYVPFFGLNYPCTERQVTGFQQMWEQTRWRSADLVMALGAARKKDRGPLRWAIEHIEGREGNGTFGIYKPGDAMFALANLALDETSPSNPASTYAPVLADEKLGYYLLRRRYADADDSVIAHHLNLNPRPASYSFKDAGGFRLYALGTRWADQQSRRDRTWSRPEDEREPNIARAMENIVQVPQTNGWPGGRLLESRIDQDAGSFIVTSDLSAAYSDGGQRLADAEPGEIEAERSFAADLSGRAGVEALVAITDRFKGPGEKVWTMHTAGRPEVMEDGFIIHGEHDATLRARFLVPEAPRLRIVEGDETHTIEARGGDDFFVVMTVQRGAAPRAAVEGEGFDAQVTLGACRVRIEDRRLQLEVAE